MKLKFDKSLKKGVLHVPYTKDEKTFYTLKLTDSKIWYWYPLDINFSYQYSPAKDRIYLSPEKGGKTTCYYDVKPVRKAEPLTFSGNIMVEFSVRRRNEYVLDRAELLDLPSMRAMDETISRDTAEDWQDEITNGFMDLGDRIDAIFNAAEERYIESPNPLSERYAGSDTWQREVSKMFTDLDQKTLHEFGEMYTMLTLMKKRLRLYL